MNRRGITITSVIVIMICCVILFVSLLVTMGGCRKKSSDRSMLTKDQTQVKAIFSGFTMWSPSHNGKYPIPGLERRLAGSSGTRVKGRGPEDMTQNDHAKVLSMSVMQNLFTTDVLFAPTEQGDNVYPMENYDYSLYDVADWIFWDDDLRNDLTGEVDGCNNSYGIIPVTGKRKQQSWGTSTHNPTTFVILGTRGPVDGIEDPYSRSNLMHGIDRTWKGVVAYGDGHTEILETFYPNGTRYVTESGASKGLDNIFLEETDQQIDSNYMPGGTVGKGQGADVILTHIKSGDVNINGKGGGVNANGYLHD